MEATLDPRSFNLTGLQLRLHAIQSAAGWRVRVRRLWGRGFGLVGVRVGVGVGGVGAHSARRAAVSLLLAALLVSTLTAFTAIFSTSASVKVLKAS